MISLVPKGFMISGFRGSGGFGALGFRKVGSYGLEGFGA